MNGWGYVSIMIGFVALVCVPTEARASRPDYFKGLSEESPMVVEKDAGEIRLLATLQPAAFGKGWLTQLPGHHAVTWKGGKKAHEALLVTFTSDAKLFEAMVSIGAKPGNNLSQDVWDERKNRNSKAPDTRVEGSPVDVLVWWEGLSAALPLAKLVNDPGGHGVDLRFGGHKDLIPVWKSGCIVCLQSCPGAKISNHAYTIRDYVEGRATFTVNEAVVPEGKHPAVVILRLKKQ
jgi:hypothetical protein